MLSSGEAKTSTDPSTTDSIEIHSVCFLIEAVHTRSHSNDQWGRSKIGSHKSKDGEGSCRAFVHTSLVQRGAKGQARRHFHVAILVSLM